MMSTNAPVPEGDLRAIFVVKLEIGMIVTFPFALFGAGTGLLANSILGAGEPMLRRQNSPFWRSRFLLLYGRREDVA